MMFTSYAYPFNRRSALVLHDHGIDSVTALHAAEDLGVVVVGIVQVIAPVVYEQARATSAGSRVELFVRRKKPNGMSISTLCHDSPPRRLFRLDSPLHGSPCGCSTPFALGIKTSLCPQPLMSL
jgi:hypothetical protein